MIIGGETRAMLHIPERSTSPGRTSLIKKTVCSGIVTSIAEISIRKEKNQKIKIIQPYVWGLHISGLSGMLPEVRNRPETNNIEISRSGHLIEFYTTSISL